MFLLVFNLVKYYSRQRYKQKLAQAGLSDIDQMDGKTFEHYLEATFERLGFTVERTPYVGDWGADLVLGKNGERTVVQAKRYAKKVGVRAVQEVVASRAKYRCSAAMVVTNSVFTAQAMELARSNQVQLSDRTALIENLLATGTVAPAEAPRAELSSSAPVCATCGKPVSEKVVQYCQSHPHRFAGRVYCYEHQQAQQHAA